MQVINALIARISQDEEGQGLAEYALILALIAIVAIIALIFLGNQISGILNTVGDEHLAAASHEQPEEAAGSCRRPLGLPGACVQLRSTGAALIVSGRAANSGTLPPATFGRSSSA